jgi:prepilin-type N-terminal cleavage/methylation domain-containing protein
MTFSANPSASPQRPAQRAGFTIVEIIVAVMILVIGLLAMAGIIGATAQLQQLTSSRAEITTLAETKLEELRAYGMSATTDPLRAKLAIGGSLTTPTAGYRDTVPNVRGKTYARSWAISQDVVGTRRVRVRVKPVIDGRNDAKWLDFTTLIWLR